MAATSKTSVEPVPSLVDRDLRKRGEDLVLRRSKNERKRGGASEYHPDIAKEAFELARSGYTDGEIAAFFGVRVRQLYYWRASHEELRTALQAGKEFADERVTNALYQSAVGFEYTEQQAIKIKTGEDTEAVEVVEVERYQPPDKTAMIFWLKNRQRDLWRDVKDHNVAGKVDVDVTAIDDRKLAMALLHLLQQGLEAGDEPITIEHQEAAE